MGIRGGLNSLVKGFIDEWVIIMFTQLIGHDAPVTEIQDGAQIKFMYLNTFIPFELRHIGKPFLIRFLRIELAVQQVDTLHFHRSRVTWKELEELPEEWLYCLHICDAPGEIPEDPDALAYTAREARLYPGEGGIDIRKIARQKAWAVYGIEISHRRRWEEMGYLKYAAEALRRTKAYLKGEEGK
jgi:hypothetical protein